ncbi:MAG: methionyl-tRNA formyltransferase [Bacteroidota bacterium]
MKIVFLGEDSFSAVVVNSLIENGYDVVMITTPYYPNYLYKRLELTAQKNKIEFSREQDIHAPAFIKKIKEHNPDLLITAHFEKLIKSELINLPKLGCLNLHPSLLPAYRGMAPQHWPIINGDKETGVTVHYIEEGIDTGNILVQKKLPLDPNIYVAALQKEMLPVYSTIMVEAVKEIENRRGKGTPQHIEEGSLYGRFKIQQAMISTDTKKMYAYNLIRAISKPYMGARFGEYILWKASMPSGENEMQLMQRFPGIGLHFDEKKAYLNLQDGMLIIDSYELIKKDERKNN